MPSYVVDRMRDIGLEHVLNGAVLPIQNVWRELLTARQVYLGHCVCRSAGIADDLRKKGQVFTTLSEANSRLLLDRVVDRYRALLTEHGKVPETADRYHQLLSQLAVQQHGDSFQYRLEALFEATHPDWELLPVHEKYTPDWIRSMHANRKAFPLHRELAFELATALYLGRGVIFTSMRLIDTPYTICSCPSPEHGGGCVLTNWYYHGMSNESLMPNEQAHGRRRDDDGELLPCRLFPVRKQRDCLGCGCDFDHARPRAVQTVLAAADRTFDEIRNR